MNNLIYKKLVGVFILLLAFGQTWAANETEYILQKQNTSRTPLYVSGHENDPEWIKGFQFSGDIFFNARKIGTFTGEIMFLNPPFNASSERYHQIFLTTDNILPGIGGYTVTANGVALGSSTFSTTSDFVLAWSGSVSNGTGTLENWYGLSAGNSIGSLFSQSGGRITEVLNLREGF